MTTNIIKIPHFKRCRKGIFKFWKESRKLCVRSYSTESNTKGKIGKVIGPLETEQNIQDEEVGIEFSQGCSMKISSGKFARLSDGCATVTLNDTTVMATAVSVPKHKGSSFVPLTVSYHQKSAALGRIPLNFLRRDMGQSENEILISRMIDRSIRPLFHKKFNWDTQLICNPLALDGNTFPDTLAINAASAALAVSDIPWCGPVASVRVGLINGQVIINPSKRDLDDSTLNLIVTGREKKMIVMLEGSAKNVVLPEILKAVSQGLKECHMIIEGIKKLQEKVGKQKRSFEPILTNPDLVNAVVEVSREGLKEIFSNHSHNKLSRDNAVSDLLHNIIKNMENEFSAEDKETLREIFHEVCREVFREVIWDTGVRCDGRLLDEMRHVRCEVDLFKPLHGSALFQRGQTQVMCTVALDSPNSALKMDRVSMLTSGVKEKNFFVHYEFPPFATNEIGKTGPIGRREIGHGALAEKALKSNVPENFPFTIRLTSEVLESNGSSSMATVCGGSLALLDAGVPMENLCAGVALGLLSKQSIVAENNSTDILDYKVLTDIMGIEDHFGDMDFKLAGTTKAITAIQMDLKIQGIPILLLSEILYKGKNAIGELLNGMNAVLAKRRGLKKSNWPEMQKVNVPPHLRAKFLGAGGINVKNLEMKVGVQITEESPGEFTIFATNKEAMAEANELIAGTLKSTQESNLEFGGIYTATIREVRDHGCMVTLFPDMTPVLIHVSQLDQRKVSHPSALGMTVGQEIIVKYFGRDPVSGMMRLSRKVLQSTASQVPRSLEKKVASDNENNQEGTENS